MSALPIKCGRDFLCRSFAGEALERERFGQFVTASYHSGLGFAGAKANLESLNRCGGCSFMQTACRSTEVGTLSLDAMPICQHGEGPSSEAELDLVHM